MAILSKAKKNEINARKCDKRGTIRDLSQCVFIVVCAATGSSASAFMR